MQKNRKEISIDKARQQNQVMIETRLNAEKNLSQEELQAMDFYAEAIRLERMKLRMSRLNFARYLNIDVELLHQVENAAASQKSMRDVVSILQRKKMKNHNPNVKTSKERLASLILGPDPNATIH